MPGKRSNGEGALRKRSSGLWECMIMTGFQPNGKRKYKSFYARTRKEVLQKVRDYQAAIEAGLDMTKKELIRIYSLCEHNLDAGITVGLHLHENMAQSFLLAQAFLEMRAQERSCVADASLNGMGRVPGNLCIELIMDYLNRNYSRSYDIDPVLDAIEKYITPVRKREPWGYMAEYFLSAKFNVHRNYAEYLLARERFTAKDMHRILQNIPREKKSAYDEEYIAALCREYIAQSPEAANKNDLSALFRIGYGLYVSTILYICFYSEYDFSNVGGNIPDTERKQAGRRVNAQLRAQLLGGDLFRVIASGNQGIDDVGFNVIPARGTVFHRTEGSAIGILRCNDVSKPRAARVLHNRYKPDILSVFRTALGGLHTVKQRGPVIRCAVICKSRNSANCHKQQDNGQKQ